MRTAFIEALCDVAERDPRVWLLTADLGYSVVEKFADRFPDRFLNAGVAEQNMTGVAAGLALSGKVVFTYSIANFPVMRCLEQIRNDVCYHNANVKVVAVGGGFAYGPHGYTHHALEDLAVMRALPNMIVLAPGDPLETRAIVPAVAAHEGPCYIRLGKAGEPVVHTDPPQFELGRSVRLRTGSAVTLISTGGMLRTAMETAALLEKGGLSCGVLSMPCVQPIDAEALSETAPLLATIEEHAERGGLHSAVLEVMPPGKRCIRFAVPSGLTFAVGSQKYLNELAGLTPERISNTILKITSHGGG